MENDCLKINHDTIRNLILNDLCPIQYGTRKNI